MRVVHPTLLLRHLRALCAICGCTFSAIPCSAVEVRIWSFEATVVEQWDPGFEASDVRLGDTVRGTFSYDLDIEPTPRGDDYVEYNHPTGYQGVRLAIENSRNGTQLDYLPAIEEGYNYWNEVTTASAFDGESALFLFQDAIVPDPDWFEFIYVEFSGENVLSDLALPAELDVDDWAGAFIILWTNPLSDGLLAQFHTITPVAAGDYDLDGKVTEGDRQLWRQQYGTIGYSDADGNRDGRVGAADYTIWRDHLRSSTAIPEPVTTQPMMIGLLVFVLVRRGGFNRRSHRWPSAGFARQPKVVLKGPRIEHGSNTDKTSI